MNKTMVIIMTVVVMGVIAASVSIISTGSLSDLSGSSDTLKDQGCEYQRQQALENGNTESVDEECRTDGFSTKAMIYNYWTS